MIEFTLPVRFSHLRAYGRSAAHGLQARRDEQSANQPMQRGTAIHALLFGTRKVIGYPGAVRRGKEYDAFVADHPDTEILTNGDYVAALEAVKTIQASKAAMKVLEGDAEKTIMFKWFGMECRATPDIRGNGYVTELKTGATSDPSRFVWHALRMQYNAQLRMQQIACQQNKNAYIVAVEQKPPFNVTVFDVQPRALEVGERNLTLWMERLKSCEAAQYWPPYVEAIVPLDIPEDLELDYGDDDEPEQQQQRYGVQI